jgi:hypothetical protein
MSTTDPLPDNMQLRAKIEAVASHFEFEELKEGC